MECALFMVKKYKLLFEATVEADDIYEVFEKEYYKDITLDDLELIYIGEEKISLKCDVL